MPRWEPHARARLTEAAVDLYATRGYDGTTIGEIAAHAGVTSRTYFRYFPDKREVLFAGADALRDRIAGSLRDAPADLAAMPAAIRAMSACEDLYDPRQHDWLRRREAIIASAGELQEREARKLDSLARAVTDRLVERGSDPDEARLVADLALAVFSQAARWWMEDPTASYPALLERAAARAGTVLTALEPQGR